MAAWRHIIKMIVTGYKYSQAQREALYPIGARVMSDEVAGVLGFLLLLSCHFYADDT